jgi:WD repeat-containing protein 35
MSSFRVFMSKRMKSPADNPITLLSWSRSNNLLASGYQSGTVTICNVSHPRDQPGSSQLEIVQSLDAHKKPITAVSWSDDGKVLSVGDSSGKVTWWHKRDKTWKHSLTNHSVTSSVRHMRWSKGSDIAAIAYDDSTCACVSENGDLNWSATMRQPVDVLEWTPGGPTLLCGTSYGEVMVIDSRGVELSTVPMPCLGKATADPKIVALEWHKRVDYGLMIAFAGGQIQLMRNETDTSPICITAGVELTCATWFKSGLALAVGAIKSPDRAVVIFFSPDGRSLRELDVQTPRISSISLDSRDTQIAIAAQNVFCLGQIIPKVLWGFSRHTLVYAYNSSDGTDYTVIYYNHKTDERRVKNMSNVVAIAGDSGNFVIVTKTGTDESTVFVTDSIGITVAVTTVPFVPFTAHLSKSAVAVTSGKKLAVWQFEEEEAPQIVSMPPDSTIAAIYLKEKLLFVSCSSSLITMDIPSLAEVSRHSMGVAAESIRGSSDGKVLALFDSAGTLQFCNASDGKIIGPARKEVWNMAWSQDTPSLFAALERHRLFVFNGLQPEEPVQSLSHNASFRSLEILTVDLIRLMHDPLHPGSRLFKTHPTLALHNLRSMLANRPDTPSETIEAYCKEQGKKKLWSELARSSLLDMNFTLAEKCYLETTNYRSLQFLKRVRAVKDARIQRAQVLSYLGKFDDAQAIYNSMDRLDLAVEMRKSIGHFQRVIDIVGGPSSVGDDELISQAYTHVGDACMERANWTEAAEHYESAGNDEQLIKCLYLADDFSGLDGVMARLPTSSPLLPILGRMFVSIGAIDNAVAAFKTCGDIAAAVDACARLNHWKPALELAGKGRSQEIKHRMTKYANELIENGQTAASVDFYARAGLGIEAARLLLREGNEILKTGDDYVSAKMCFVFAGLQIEKDRKSAFDSGATAAERLDGLMRDDEATTSGLVDEVWRRAEAVHFYLLAHRQMFAKRWTDALICACRVFDDYAEIIGMDRAAAMLAYCGWKTRHFGQCSRAMTTLEHYEEFTPEKRAQLEELAIDIFTKNPPADPKFAGGVSCSKCSAPLTPFQSQCTECGNKAKVCVSSGRPILDDATWDCQVCKHFTLLDFADDLGVCPMCHHIVTS